MGLEVDGHIATEFGVCNCNQIIKLPTRIMPDSSRQRAYATIFLPLPTAFGFIKHISSGLNDLA